MLQRNLIASLLFLSFAVVPALQATPPSIGFLDAGAAPLSRIAPGETLTLEGRDDSCWVFPVVLTASGGDTETIDLYYFGGYPYDIYFRETIATEAGAADPEDGILQVEDGGEIEASHANCYDSSPTTTDLPVASALIEILDRREDVVEHVLAEGMVWLRVTSALADTDPGNADLLEAELRTVDLNDSLRDTETIDLVETGAATGIFEGHLPIRMAWFRSNENGTLESWQTSGENDRVEVQVGAIQKVVPQLAGVLRIVDGSGDDLEEVEEADLVRLHLLSEAYNMSPVHQDMAYIRVRSNTTGDLEYPVLLSETGLDTGVFLGNFVTVPGVSPSPGNAALETQEGETIEVKHQTLFGTALDTAEVLAGSNPVNYPPNAVADSTSTPVNTAVAISVLANDSDPDSDPISIALFTQSSGGGTVTQTGPATLTYTPPASRTIVDSFWYRVTDSHGAQSVGIVTVSVY